MIKPIQLPKQPYCGSRGSRTSICLDVTDQEYELLSNLGRGNDQIEYRHDALVKITDIVNTMKLEPRKRVSVRIKLSNELYETIEAKHRQTARARIHILLHAIESQHAATVPQTTILEAFQGH